MFCRRKWTAKPAAVTGFARELVMIMNYAWVHGLQVRQKEQENNKKKDVDGLNYTGCAK